MPKFSWKKFLTELGRTLLPIVITRIYPIVAEKLSSGEDETTTGEDNPNQVIYGRRSTDTFEEAERLIRK